MIEWTNLTSCLGKTTQSPSDKDLKSALFELFKSRDNEHPDAWIECGSENGPLYSLSVFSSGYALYTKYSDADMSEELENKRIENITQDSAFSIWKSLINSKILDIESLKTYESSKPKILPSSPWWKFW